MTDDADFDEPDLSREEPRFPFRIPGRLCPDADEAELRARAENGDARARYDLGVLLLEASRALLGTNLKQVAEALRFFGMAADGGVGEGEFAYGCVEMTVVGLKSVRDARDCFAKAAELGYAPGAEALEWVDSHYRLMTFTVLE